MLVAELRELAVQLTGTMFTPLHRLDHQADEMP
jgi:hypothetical protein